MRTKQQAERAMTRELARLKRRERDAAQRFDALESACALLGRYADKAYERWRKAKRELARYGS